MNDSLVRALLTSALMAFSVANYGHAQRSYAGAPRQQQPGTAQESQSQDTRQRPSSDEETQNTLAFTGRLVKVKGQILLKDPVTKMNYQLNNALKAKPFIGKQVKVVGKLNLNSNVIYVDSITPTL